MNGDKHGALGSYHVERLSSCNMKRTFVSHGKARDWFDPAQGCGEEFLQEASEVKNIWVPMGEEMTGIGDGGGY
jgi:aldehyde dehydrogenase (NAD+)